MAAVPITFNRRRSANTPVYHIANEDGKPACGAAVVRPDRWRHEDMAHTITDHRDLCGRCQQQDFDDG